MNTATVIHMEDREEKENRYKDSRDEIKSMKKQVEEMTRVLGSVDEAIRGNDRGTIGFVKQIDLMKTEMSNMKFLIEKLEERFFKMELDMKNRLKIWGIVFTLSGIIIGTLFKAFIDKFSKK